jgi:crotonobetainyl-CoA:carnitine CoA-transferase CaiB-like acyl-CoA transferase
MKSSALLEKMAEKFYRGDLAELTKLKTERIRMERRKKLHDKIWAAITRRNRRGATKPV